MIIQYDTIKSELEDGIATVILGRPESLNEFFPTLRETVDCLQKIHSLDRDESEPNIRTVVVEGAGQQAFNVGTDVNADSDAPQLTVNEFRDELVLPQISRYRSSTRSMNTVWPPASRSRLPVTFASQRRRANWTFPSRGSESVQPTVASSGSSHRSARVSPRNW